MQKLKYKAETKIQRKNLRTVMVHLLRVCMVEDNHRLLKGLGSKPRRNLTVVSHLGAHPVHSGVNEYIGTLYIGTR